MHGVAELHLQVAHGLQNTLKFAHIGLLLGGLDVEILVGHLIEQIADIVDDGIQTRHHLRCGVGELRRLVLAPGLGDGGVQISLHQQLHPGAHRPHGHTDIAGQLQGHHNGG